MRRLGSLIVLLLAAWVQTAGAARTAQLVTPKVERGLGAGARRNLHATVAIEGDSNGSGVVLHRRRGLVVTNAHVAAENPSHIHTVSGGKVPVREVIYVDAERDVAFLRVGRLPAGTTDAIVAPGKPTQGQQVYSINSGEGYLDARRVLAGEHQQHPKRFVRAHRDRLVAPGAPRTLVELADHLLTHEGNLAYRILGRGRVHQASAKVPVVNDGRSTKLKIMLTDLPDASAASGGGVFGRDSDALVAVHVGGGRYSSTEIAVHRVVGAAKKGLAKGEVKASKAGVAALSAWVSELGR